MRFDANTFIDGAFGGLQELHNLLQLRGVEPPSLDTLRKWKERSQIPAPWLPVLLYVLETDKGQAISLGPYMIGGDFLCKSLNEKPLSTGAPLGVFD